MNESPRLVSTTARDDAPATHTLTRCAPAARYDETAVVRIHRGMFTNNKGTREERLQETADTFARVHEWKARVGMDDDAKFFGSPLAAAPGVYAAWPTVLGGEVRSIRF